MNKMIAIALLTGATAMGVAVPAPCQDQSDYSIQQKLQKLTDELSLTPDQQAQVRDILEEQHVKKESLISQSRTAKEALKVETQARIRGVLTGDQKARFDQLKSGMGGAVQPDQQGASDPGAAPAAGY